MEEDSELARAAILEAVENQLRDNNPPMVRETLERLIREGYSDDEARELIAVALAVEIYNAASDGYDEARYRVGLEGLPDLPLEDDDEQGV
ncbi:MAG: hypothetical protein JJT88_00505 [Gammaproteobacteria bacterium]|nr:hypothetical protein [Gammaproteobacteria bacterium]